MSCHSIGKGINAIVRRTITLYDRGEIAFEPTKKIIATCANAVNWCDGNDLSEGEHPAFNNGIHFWRKPEHWYEY